MFLKSLLTSGAACAFAVTLSAQSAKPEIKIDQVDMKVEQQFTPKIEPVNVVDKRWLPKTWLELQVNFKSTIANDLGGRLGTYPSIEAKYFLALSGAKTKEGKQVVLTGTINFKDVPSGDCHLLAYVTPATLKRMLKKENGGKSDVAAFGVEISAGGVLLGGKSSGGKWWEPADKLSLEEGVLSKDKTPFAPLWGDYDLATAGK